MRTKLTNELAAIVLALVGAGLMAAFPDEWWLGSVIIAAAALVLIFYPRLADDGRVAFDYRPSDIGWFRSLMGIGIVAVSLGIGFYKYEGHEADLAARQAKADLLIELIREGTAIFYEQLSSEDQQPEWNRRASLWVDSSFASISAQLSPQEAGFFANTVGKIRPQDFFRAVNPAHNAGMKAVEAHIGNLNWLLQNYLPGNAIATQETTQP